MISWLSYPPQPGTKSSTQALTGIELVTKRRSVGGRMSNQQSHTGWGCTCVTLIKISEKILTSSIRLDIGQGTACPEPQDLGPLGPFRHRETSMGPRRYVHPNLCSPPPRQGSGDLEPQHFLPKWPPSPFPEPIWASALGLSSKGRTAATCVHVPDPGSGCVTGTETCVGKFKWMSLRTLPAWN